MNAEQLKQVGLLGELKAAEDELDSGKLAYKDFNAIRREVLSKIKALHRKQYGFAMRESVQMRVVK